MSRAGSEPVPGTWEGVRWARTPGTAGGGIGAWRLAARAAWGALVHGKALRNWMAIVAEMRSRQIVRDVPGEYLRALRPSVHRGTGIRERIVQLTDHHDWMEAAFTPAAFGLLAAGEPVVLCELTPPRGFEWMRVQVRRAAAQSPEGELLLVLAMQRSADLQHRALPIEACVLAFSRFRIDRTACFVIGGVRGQRHPVQRVGPAELNQALQGWKPSVFLVQVAQELARFWSLNLVALDPAAHRLHGWSYRLRPRTRRIGAKIFESYRALWEHFDAVNGPPGWVILPPHADDKLAATARSPEKRERQVRRADYWLRTRAALRTCFRETLQRPSMGASLARITQAMESGDMPGQQQDEALDIDSDTQMIPSRLLETGPASLY